VAFLCQSGRRAARFWPLLALLLLSPMPSAGKAGRPMLGPLLSADLGSAPVDAFFPVDVVLHDEWQPETGLDRRDWIRRRQAEVLASLPASEFALTHRYVNLCGFAGVASRWAIALLQIDSRVARIALDARGKLDLVQGVALIGADQAQSLGFTGAGINVAVLDSGVDAMAVDLNGAIVAEACFCTIVGEGGCCPNNEDRDSGPGSAQDTDGHGTAVTGVVTADGLLVGPGVAPDAGIVAIKVGEAGGSIGLSDLGAGLDWLLTNHLSLNVRVVNLSVSFGSTPFNDPAVCAGLNNTANAIAALSAEGVVVFASSGNNGWTTGISFPACVPEAISVGAVYDADFGSLNWGVCSDPSAATDTFACFTNSGDLLDLLAPGWQTSTVGNSGFGGTSAASPYAAGQAALLLQQDGQLSPAAIRDRMTQSGPLVVNPATSESYPRSDVAEALPEPGTLLTLISGAALLGAIGHRRYAR
jgi:subtilisin family serine protease